MKRYLVKVKTFDASLYEVLDRYTGKYYDAWVFGVAFRDYPGTLEQLAADIEFTEESIDNLNTYGVRYYVAMHEALKAPRLYMELNEKGKFEKKWREEQKQREEIVACLG
ncbi:MAG: hypothetical protein ACI4Q0_05765 [Oligosphaeraceae bacterium]